MEVLAIMIQYILLFIITLSTMYSIYLGDAYTITGILGIIFMVSCILRSKSKSRNIIVNLAFWISSIIIVISFILGNFI
ncbi:hypothetical protein [Paraclostridium ghonii]|uniref:Oxidoreductase n=1 Tax=Paraclostridium ghonii TaxID=29358 RepID=A0ABU0MZ71_9FIRM|nr:hypothetical protein [Paeniclostridium ghonii]MDQ0555904.1 putative oxidoreductase [Paeniclostridium ghonii]